MLKKMMATLAGNAPKAKDAAKLYGPPTGYTRYNLNAVHSAATELTAICIAEDERFGRQAPALPIALALGKKIADHMRKGGEPGAVMDWDEVRYELCGSLLILAGALLPEGREELLCEMRGETKTPGAWMKDGKLAPSAN